MPDGSLQNGTFEVAADQDQPKRKRNKRRARELKITAAILLAAGVGTGAFVALGFQQGWLTAYWSDLSDGQGAVIASALTLYAAALAAVIGPLIFTGQITSMREATDQAIDDMVNHVQQISEQLDYVRKRVEQDSKPASAQSPDPTNSLEEALLVLEGIRQDAASIAVDTLARSRKWDTTKAKFAGKWPGRRKYTEMLLECGLINEQQRELFDRIDATRRFTREKTIPPMVLVQTQAALNELKESLRRAPGN